MSTGQTAKVLAPNRSWTPTAANLSRWKSLHPTDVWKADSSNSNWKDLNGGNVSQLPTSGCGFAIWEWQGTVGSPGQWVLISSTCSPSTLRPNPPAISAEDMPQGMRIRKSCC
jgi:hypothetical protein